MMLFLVISILQTVYFVYQEARVYLNFGFPVIRAIVSKNQAKKHNVKKTSSSFAYGLPLVRIVTLCIFILHLK